MRARIILTERGQKIAMSSVQPTVDRVYKIKVEPRIGNFLGRKRLALIVSEAFQSCFMPIFGKEVQGLVRISNTRLID